MKKHFFYIGKISMALAMVGLLLLVSNTLAQGQPIAGKSDPYAPQFLTNAPPPGFATREDYLKSFTSEKDILDAYHAGLINKDESMLAMGALEDKEEDKASMDTYGKAVDQDGQPVAGVKVLGRLELGIGEYKDYHAETDSQGLFQFVGSHGSGLILHFQKQGYDFDGNLLPERPKNYLPDPNTPLMITMWKLRGAEPLMHRELESRIPYDGTSAVFNLTTAQKSTNGNLKITLLRSPLKIRRGVDKYDWNVKIEMTNGVLLAESSPYPYWAPEGGYQPAFVTGMSSNSVAWDRELKQDFYIKDGQGKYGRVFIDLFTDATRPDTGIKIQTWLNPSGSQNLEFDPSKQINQ